jgi:hypothetical protein
VQSVSLGSQAVILDRTSPNLGALDYFDLRMEHPDIDIFEIDEEAFPTTPRNISSDSSW